MFTLVVIGLVAGLVTSISPCVLPVLPVVLTAGATDRPADRRSWRPVWVVVGLVAGFCVATLLGSLVLSALGLPQDLLRDIGIAVLLIVGIALVVPRFAELVERPFRRLVPRAAGRPRGSGLGVGLALGLLYVPCAGPVLATIAVVGATHHVGWRGVVLTIAYGVGVGIPLLILALAGDALTARVGALRRRARELRIAGGVVMIVLALLITFDVTDALQRHVPGYTAALQRDVEGSTDARAALGAVTGRTKGSTTVGTPAASHDLGGRCTEDGPELENCGRAPDFAGIEGWLNTPGERPLTMAGLRGKVVLIDFWTYSCINCQRALPHVEAWYRNYAKAGLVVVGVHTPEFAFEHVPANVRAQSSALGVRYPVAIDNDYDTWNAYQNQYWPAEYLIDAQGYVRHLSFGEGGYAVTEQLIRELLRERQPGDALGQATHVPAARLDDDVTSETYLGYGRTPLHTTSGVTLTRNRQRAYRFPSHVDPDGFALSGQWTQRAQYLTPGRDAELELSYRARHVYLVLGGTGRVGVEVDGKPAGTVHVSGVPRLYPLHSTATANRHLLTLSVSSGVRPYVFTFG